MDYSQIIQIASDHLNMVGGGQVGDGQDYFVIITRLFQDYYMIIEQFDDYQVIITRLFHDYHIIIEQFDDYQMIITRLFHDY